MRVILWIERRSFLGAERVEFVGHHPGEIEERHAAGLRGLVGPVAVAAGAALNFSLGPDVAQREREDDGRGALARNADSYF